MSVSVRSGGKFHSAASSRVHSTVLRETAAKNVLASSRRDQSFTDSKMRRTADTLPKKDTAVITIDDLQRIRAQCT
jgi:hypothetical protein